MSQRNGEIGHGKYTFSPYTRRGRRADSLNEKFEVSLILFLPLFLSSMPCYIILFVCGKVLLHCAQTGVKHLIVCLTPKCWVPHLIPAFSPSYSDIYQMLIVCHMPNSWGSFQKEWSVWFCNNLNMDVTIS